MRVISAGASIEAMIGLAEWLVGFWYALFALQGAGRSFDEIYEVMG